MARFLTPLKNVSPDGFFLRNTRTGLTVADRLLTAFDSRTRNVGLLRHTSMPAMSAMIIAPTNAIHTFFMKFAIDVAFVTKEGQIVGIRSALHPWRIAWARRAYAVIELRAGELATSQTRVGDELVVVERLPAHA